MHGSLFNEPETITDYAYEYFKEVFAAAETYDFQSRPMTGAFEKNSKPELCKCYPLCDFICLNRYYGWYISGGPEIEEAEELFRDEMDRWKALTQFRLAVFSQMPNHWSTLKVMFLLLQINMHNL